MSQKLTRYVVLCSGVTTNIQVTKNPYSGQASIDRATLVLRSDQSDTSRKVGLASTIRLSVQYYITPAHHARLANSHTRRIDDQ